MTLSQGGVLARARLPGQKPLLSKGPPADSPNPMTSTKLKNYTNIRIQQDLVTDLEQLYRQHQYLRPLQINSITTHLSLVADRACAPTGHHARHGHGSTFSIAIV